MTEIMKYAQNKCGSFPIPLCVADKMKWNFTVYAQ